MFSVYGHESLTFAFYGWDDKTEALYYSSQRPVCHDKNPFLLNLGLKQLPKVLMLAALLRQWRRLHMNVRMGHQTFCNQSTYLVDRSEIWRRTAVSRTCPGGLHIGTRQPHSRTSVCRRHHKDTIYDCEWNRFWDRFPLVIIERTYE